MNPNQFVTFRKFSDINSTKELTNFLAENNIEYLFEDNSSNLDSTFGSNEFSKEFEVKLKKEDFDRVDKLMDQISINQEDIDKDYYLFDFIDDELKDLIANKDEWSNFDYLLALKLLKEKGKEVKEEELELLKKQRLEVLSQPEENQKICIFAGYFFAFCGGFLGLIIGWLLSTNKKVLPNGDKVYIYSEGDRKHGKNILYIGIFFSLLWIILYKFS